MEFGSVSDFVDSINNSVYNNNAWSAEMAQKQMDFQERMSNTAHQREVADLKAAGLNPVLSAQHAGASTPAGSYGNPDQSGTSALASLAGAVIQSNTAMANALTSANASELVANIAAWSAGNVAQLNNAGAAYRLEKEQEWNSSNPKNAIGVLSSLVDNVARGLGFSSSAKAVQSYAPSVVSTVKSGLGWIKNNAGSLLRNSTLGKQVLKYMPK